MSSPSLGIAGYLLITTVFPFGSLAATPAHHSFANLTFENRSQSTRSDALSKQLLANDSRWQHHHRNRNINIDGFSNMTSRDFILDTTALEIDITAHPGNSISTINSSSISPSGGIPILLTDQPVLPVPTFPEPTISTALALTHKLSSILDRAVPFVAPEIVSRTNSREQATRQVIATGVSQGAYRVEASQQRVPNFLETMMSLLGDLDSAIKNVVQEITTNPADDLSASNLRRRSETVSSGLDSITNTINGSTTSDGPATTDSQLSLTTPVLSRLEIILETVATHANRTVTVLEYCHSTITETISLAGVIPTLAVYGNQPCPTNPPCPACVYPTCHCPNAGGAGGATATSLSGIPDARGPCPGSGYTCHECLDGWFCPPLQTPAQPAPCGFGWPCAHCDGGWFCVPQPTLGPEICAGSSRPAANDPGTISSTASSPRNPSQPSLTQPTGSGPTMPSPKSPREASSWGYCGCWADQADNRALDMEPLPSLGPLTNEGCVQHCIGRGFLMAGTENGDSCYCGNFLNGTQKLDDSVCSVSCTGDSKQACGGNDALSCYSSDNQAHGWASAGPQPLPATAIPPEVISMNVGGVAQTVVTGPAVIFPPPDADMSQLVSQFGHKTRQPQGELPNNMGSNSAIPASANGGSTPGASTTPPNGSGGVTSGRCTEEPGSFSSGGSAAGPTSPRGNGGSGNSPPNNSGTTPDPGNGGSSSNTNGDVGPSPTTPRSSLTVLPNGNSGTSPSFGQGSRPNSASNDGMSGGPTSGSSSNTSPSNSDNLNPTGSGHGSPSNRSMPSQNSGLGSAPSSGNGGASSVTPGENPSSPASPSADSNSDFS
ncbi:hypothetical protein F4814DRAFT_65667 [Daldinia grandis]|nr:hypothetical protein F4814DRAFT_65667 [Daldinia grandis]